MPLRPLLALLVVAGAYLAGRRRPVPPVAPVPDLVTS